MATMKDVSVGGTMSEKEYRERGNLIIIWLILDPVTGFFIWLYMCRDKFKISWT